LLFGSRRIKDCYARYSFKCPGVQGYDMGMTREQYCPNCESEQTFTRAATTHLNVGQKIKWRCDACGRQTVQIGTEIDTATI